MSKSLMILILVLSIISILLSIMAATVFFIESRNSASNPPISKENAEIMGTINIVLMAISLAVMIYAIVEMRKIDVSATVETVGAGASTGESDDGTGS